MSVPRGIEDIERELVRHQHDHPPVRDLNREAERRRSFAQRRADELARVVGSWTFIALQVVLAGAWVGLNLTAVVAHWDPVPFLLLNLALSFECALWVLLVLMTLNRLLDRERLRAQQDYEAGVKLEEELRSLMTHLEVQDDVLLQVLVRLEQTDRELRRLARRLGVEERVP